MPRRLLVLNVILLAVAAAAAAYIVQAVTTPPRPAPLRPRAGAEPGPPPTPAAPAAPAPPGSYAVVASRNLFSPSRSEAPPSGTQPGRPAVAVPKPTLHGVVLGDGTPIAYLEDPQTKRVAGYRLGDAVAGGTVKAINADHVVLVRPEGPVEVRLRDPSKPRPAPPPVVSAPVPGAPLAPGALLPPAPGVVPPVTPGLQPGQPGQVPMPPRRMLPPNVLRRVPPATTDATR